MIRQIGDYKILTERATGAYIVVNTKGDYKNHGHFKQVKTCELVIDLMMKQKVPRSKYLLEAVIRITTDKVYKERLLRIQQNRRNKQMYYNVNKGKKR